MDSTPDAHNPDATYLRDYHAPAFTIERVSLRFELEDEETRVEAQLQVVRAAATAATEPLVLAGDGLRLASVHLDGRRLAAVAYEVSADQLVLRDVPDTFQLTLVTLLRPQDNTALSGLYKSSGNFCTQCEAEGFRRITYFLDRPDVMARYDTTLVADRARYPVLLSNGNLVASGDLDGGRHWARWEDPFPKPSYLFALVAGTLDWIEDEFTTTSGRRVQLFVYVQPHNIDQCAHAMASLQRAMRWDEEVYGREYDLDRYMIVAVDDFNMGAMENKGLNIFNSKYVLARPDTATDQDYQHIEGVIGHEYFHNWSGNRVTCRDWFQLSLKEGFTVFRDQEFSADMGARAVKRIQDVDLLRTHQFREDAGPMAHPVRPESYVEINNFYTATVYNKGAEIVRMLHTLVGPDGFRRGTDLYFERHDGQAVTTDDFVQAIEDANGLDLQQFRRWYSQAGTPVVQVERRFDAAARTCSLTLRQSCPATPGQPHKLPFHIPVTLALLDAAGHELPLRLPGEAAGIPGSRTLQLCEEQQTFVFQDVPAEPVPSLLRGFSAPVRLDMAYTEAELGFLLAHDGDAFGRWEAGQQLAVRLLLALARDGARPPDILPTVIEAFGRVLRDPALDPAFRALALALPSEVYLAEFLPVIDPDALHSARQALRRALATALQNDFEMLYHGLADTGPYRNDADAIGRRSLRNLCLGYLLELDDGAALDLCLAQYRGAANMTDALAAVAALAHREEAVAEAAVADFYARWRDEPLVVDKWLAIQALSRRRDTLARVQALATHPAFTLKNPNKVYALLRTFSQANAVRFHQADGAGYRFLAAQIERLDALNPQVAARMVTVFNDWRRYDETRQAQLRGVLQRLRDKSNLSRDTFEIVARSLVG